MDSVNQVCCRSSLYGQCEPGGVIQAPHMDSVNRVCCRSSLYGQCEPGML